MLLRGAILRSKFSFGIKCILSLCSTVVGGGGGRSPPASYQVLPDSPGFSWGGGRPAPSHPGPGRRQAPSSTTARWCPSPCAGRWRWASSSSPSSVGGGPGPAHGGRWVVVGGWHEPGGGGGPHCCSRAVDLHPLRRSIWGRPSEAKRRRKFLKTRRSEMAKVAFLRGVWV